MDIMGKRTGKTLPKNTRFLATETDDFTEIDGLGRFPHGSGAGSASGLNRFIAHRIALYKIEAQESHNRWNIWIRGLPEATRGACLYQWQFQQPAGKPGNHPLKFKRVHQALCPRNLFSNTQRDIICRVHYFEKELIMQKAREAATLEFDEETPRWFQWLQ